MKILFPTWKSFGVEDIKETFEKLGHSVLLYKNEPKNYRIDPKYKSEIKKYIREKQCGCSIYIEFLSGNIRWMQ